MKTIKIIVVLFLAGSLSTSAQKSEINIEKSVVKWTGEKIGGSHTGAIKLKNGNFEFKGDQIIGGTVVMDMNSMTNSDLSDEGYNQKLIGHLKSDDFFGVEKYPIATFEITKSSKFTNGKASVSGKLTIKGKTEELTFDVLKEGAKYSAQVEVDRSKFDVRYGSNSFFDNLGDKAIDDIFTLAITLSL
ncbi:YceI family protein [Bacteroidales bacterium]|nr:YceI family protein [Bacteroidales bacterium]